MGEEPPFREELIRVQALHALLYCERLFFLEEVEEIRVADAAVFAGRRLHRELDEGERLSLEVSSEALGLTGRVDAVRRRDGALVVTEQKRGRPKPDANASSGFQAWDTDRVQVAAYGMLVEEAFPGTEVECRVRYHQPSASVLVPLDTQTRALVCATVARARAVRESGKRPSVTTEERRCGRCSLAPVCLPEEERVEATSIPRLFPEDDVRQVVHVATPGARIGKHAEELRVSIDGQEDVKLGAKN